MKLNVDGREVFATTGGADLDPRRPTVIFLHGAGFDRTTWRLQTRWFAHHGRSVLAVDFPGHGWSEGPALDSIAAMADWTAALVEAAGLEQAALVEVFNQCRDGGIDFRAAAIHFLFDVAVHVPATVVDCDEAAAGFTESR